METEKLESNIQQNKTFNFLASLINGNSFVSGFTADTNKTPFNFLASLINGNLPPHSSLYRRVLNLF